MNRTCKVVLIIVVLVAAAVAAVILFHGHDYVLEMRDDPPIL
jgi:uncharacterized protein involved in outer membrane biogenesis